MISNEVLLSKFPVGSSAKMIEGLFTKALATAQHTSLTLAVLGHSASAALLAFYADPATRGVRFV